MNRYYDTGLILKLYTSEIESDQVEAFVKSRGDALQITDLHLTEMVSALRLKAYRGECSAVQSDQAVALVNSDVESGILRLSEVDWPRIWQECRLLAGQYAAELGVRTLDTLHVATARLLEAKVFVTSDRRQERLAGRVGLVVCSPFCS